MPKSLSTGTDLEMDLPFSEVGRDLHLTVKASLFKIFLCSTKVFAILYRDGAPWVPTYFSLACLSACTTASTPSLCLLMVDVLQPPRMKCMVPGSLLSSPHCSVEPCCWIAGSSCSSWHLGTGLLLSSVPYEANTPISQ